MRPKLHIGKIDERHLQWLCNIIRELQPDEDLFIGVNRGTIRAWQRKDGEKYVPFADNDFIYSLFFSPCKDYPGGVVKLTFSN